MITVGISMATIASAQQLPDTSAPNQTEPSRSSVPSEHSSGEDLFTLSIGIAMLLFALFTSARMGIYQEVLYGTHGKHPREAMFYTHALSLPGFLLLASDIWSKMLSFSASGILPCVFFTVYRDPLDSRYCFLPSRANLELWICQPSKNVGLPAGQLYYSVSYKCVMESVIHPGQKQLNLYCPQ